MTTSPEWATWSLQGASRAKPSGSPINGGSLGEGAICDAGGGAGLFTRTAQEDIYKTTWHDFKEPGYKIEEGEMGEVESSKNDKRGIEAVSLVELFPGQGGGSIVDTSTQELDLLEGGHYRFDPLTQIESRALERALKLSKYIPPSAKEKEEEKQRMLAIKVIAMKTPKGDRRAKGRRINEETGKRFYNLANGASGVIIKQNNEAKEVLKTMCKSMLPKRHFDWILAQLTYNRHDMIGFDNIPSFRALVQEEAKESVRDKTMPIYNLAYVTKLLADASKVDTSMCEIIDPTRSARARGEPATSVKKKMMIQSEAIFQGLQKLYPKLFGIDVDDEELVRSSASQAMAISTIETEPSLRESTSTNPAKDEVTRSTPPTGQVYVDGTSSTVTAVTKIPVQGPVLLSVSDLSASGNTILKEAPASNQDNSEKESKRLFYAKLEAQRLKRERKSEDKVISEKGEREMSQENAMPSSVGGKRKAEVESKVPTSILESHINRSGMEDDTGSKTKQISDLATGQFKVSETLETAPKSKKRRQKSGVEMMLPLPSFWQKK